jgi:hypothetical protein
VIGVNVSHDQQLQGLDGKIQRRRHPETLSDIGFKTLKQTAVD